MTTSATVITKKICIIGDFGVGKTSLVARFVHHAFSDKYLSTVGVSIKTKVVNLSSTQDVKLIIWDIAGEDALSSAAERYLRGANGLLVVADGTRPATLGTGEDLLLDAQSKVGEIPAIRLVNKADLADEWASPPGAGDSSSGDTLITSAKTGLNVEAAFEKMAAALI